MRILIVSATTAEISFLSENISSARAGNIFSVFVFKQSIDILITGVGMTLTAFHLGMCLQQNKYDLVINLGLAGAFNKQLQLGEVVEINSDSFGDLGAEEDRNFLSVIDLGLVNENDYPFRQGKLFAQHLYQQQIKNLRSVEGVTVNKVHGNDISIDLLRKRCTADVETMEGAAFLYVCLYNKINCVQVRGISNYVEKRDKSKWNIPLALQQLELFANKFLMDAS